MDPPMDPPTHPSQQAPFIQIELPAHISQELNAIVQRSAPQDHPGPATHDVSSVIVPGSHQETQQESSGVTHNGSRWIQLRFDADGPPLYFDLATQQLWREDPCGSSSDDPMVTDLEPPAQVPIPGSEGGLIRDSDILAASRIVESSGVSELNLSLNLRPPLDAYSSGTITPRASSSDLPASNQQQDASTCPPVNIGGSANTQRPLSPAIDTGWPDSAPDRQGVGSPSRHTSRAKGKGRAADITYESDTDDLMNGSDGDAGTQGRPATVDDILRLAMSIQRGQEAMTDAILKGLSSLQNSTAERHTATERPDYADDEGSGPSRSMRPKKYCRKRRSPYENNLSDRIRMLMKKMIGEEFLTANTVDPQEIEKFDPLKGPCCDAENFRIHLDGTPANPWNRSAAEVFVAKFLATYSRIYPPDLDEVVNMVHSKTRSAITSLIKDYRLRQDSDYEEKCQDKKRRERKRLLFERRLDLTFLYPSLGSQRPLLEAIGIDGMSSDEEETIPGSSIHQYRIYVPCWRSHWGQGHLESVITS
ncbi:hypothetical protein BJ322DRAFT_1109737 [Thelephora terrestris]|uniref:Uncharacterized protein n=1 Tax=Thelephora terrestris TaxID=56493 RepID=A0A9P6HCP1_9AGAM|nr:hypothetical protein BJ322DRAFT_1109737 [Thelephora terrestris]